MKTSQTITNLSKALLKAQAAMGGAVKGAKNSFFKSNYSDYNSVLEVVKEPLNENGILVLQPTVVREGKTLVETTLIHAESGEFISGEMEVITAKQNDPQSYGAAITYMRRYSLQSMLSIPSEDSDAEGAMNRPQKAPEAPKLAPHSKLPPVESSATPTVVASTPVTKPSSFKAQTAKVETAPVKPAASSNLDW